ncbi:hypothetical protein A3D80_02135 [Candidatus Roizmanbacteria bacterium RIFCSPHIGHO2_02_FULL_40_13b]|uniref:Zinc finger DksA/TraR C4-type domain-containing protein n=1 Tax=Candidatus Roizmanbacteria bacterium RIFCSPHIGHO2_01_FULL_39_24 TaxID=1802032 RepID=A0A1F7GGX9_9BACT|nr:MAG: hypothetical protein A2799_04705 [Candidatus Roizmanbacteria bacterium RIFCSPHIGHO2_01_FULL_39_24]OGK26633.1 MAG: hypothetical protein A3D80_02135 [Candidatus Roizmanbacteria bacterium RIFCSPHIGHO2_02_FULL_40_13b]OGK48944.1 MAG: hypothetical protein A3A56_02570 [Candidatus Roizmanbacteria bacterium RIFCSPLOWO2_01_FULL_40_32]OGK56067.1 MAG: hypothetical protein A3H83_03795 [Candidatus Roizmanbacteria bacterium RIFCSPLOWO2_02_FULL_39_8]
MNKPFSKEIVETLHKKLINEERDILARVRELKADDPFSNPDHVNDNAAIDTDVREQTGHDTIEAQVISLEKRLFQIQAAFKKIAEKKYGTCENCSKQILLARLQLVPEARYCIDCEKKFVK